MGKESRTVIENYIKGRNSMLINWKANPMKYSNGWLGYFGKYVMFELYYQSGSQSEDRKGIDHKLVCRLPGLKIREGVLYSVENGKKVADATFEVWLNGAGLQIKRIK
jgi:hypothetical protein